MSTLKTDRGNAGNDDTRAQRSQRSSFLREEHLDFAKDDIVSRWQFVGFLIHLLFNLIDSAQNWWKIELNSWSRLIPTARWPRSLFPGSMLYSQMSKRSAISFTRRGPDNITEELIALLSSKTSFEFKPLFEIMLLNLRERNAASGGEEMLRLRAYEKLQGLVNQGAVHREVTGGTKKYKGVAARMALMRTEMKALRAACNQRARAKAAAGK
jgi:lipid-A-disaccharide synthase-like uncharacterized protein